MTIVSVPCKECGDTVELSLKMFNRKQKQNKGGNIFCNRECANKYNGERRG